MVTWTLLAMVLATLAGCGAPADSAAPPATPQAEQAAPAPDVVVAPGSLASAVAWLTAGGEGPFATSARERQETSALYASGAPLWLDAQGRAGPDARAALAVLGAARDHGLDAAAYDAAGLERRAGSLEAPGTPLQARAEFDVALSLGMLRFWRDLHLGRVDPRTIGFRIPGPADDHDFPALLREAATGHRVPAATDDLVPPLVLYRAVMRALARYRELAARVRPFTMAEPAASIKPGASMSEGPALLAWLVALGDLPADTPPPTFDWYEEPLVSAIERFQARHGLEIDGVIGRRTAAALSVPLDVRVRQLELSLERVRWLPHPSPQGFLAVNIPMFRLWGWDVVPPDGTPTFDMNVIVGRALDTETPVLVEEMRYLTFRPYWNVPPSIVRGEILPAVSRDAGYLDTQNMEIVSGHTDEARPVPQTAENLERLRRGELRVRQRPGPKNSLGLVKFSFPNDDNIYMHGTPAPQLFGRARRDFSHGCVRLQDPVAMAEWVLRDRPEWTRDRIQTAMNGDRPVRVTLTRPLPVILFYLTAVVMPGDGSVHFADDIYGHDARLDEALAGTASVGS